MKRTSTALRTIAGILLVHAPFYAAAAQGRQTQPSVELAVNSDPASPIAVVPAAPLAFELADVHVSPASKATAMSGGWLDGDHFIVYHATLIELIAKAYGFQIRKIRGGPAWLDIDRFDIAAQAPPGTPDDDLKAMLRSLLADRFHLVVHTEDKPLPAYLITAPRGSSGMKQSDGSGTPGCKSRQPTDDTPVPGTPVSFSCHAESMSAFADFLYEIMWNPTQREVDVTGLQGKWDFDFNAIYPPRVSADTANNFHAIESTLGLKVEGGTAPLPVLVIDSVNETPAANPPGVAAILPPAPPAQFDVASIKPSSPDTKEVAGHIGGGQIDLTGVTLQFLINFALELNDQTIANPPKWLDQDKFDIVAKVTLPDAAPGSASPLPFNDEALPQMMKKLLEQRFAMKWHMEDRPADTYVLLADHPRIKKADPLYHSGCQESPGPDGKDPRIENPIRGRLFSCQNTTMAQFAQVLPIRSTGYIKTPLFDATGLTGAYDIVLSFSGYSQVGGINEWSQAAAQTGNSSAGHLVVPPGGLLLFDAIQQQLGLKLEKQRRLTPTLVIDHLDEIPVQN